MHPVPPFPSRPFRQRPRSILLPAPLRLLMRRATDPLRCRAVLAQMYGYWEP
ncbi:hypothetical protein G5V65_15580 [Rhodobacter sp. HX-7-19]|jgi:hypothetical protein|uniref:Uncharacterized protein n=1 Tax=Paragemmobacter kunshanensis TaxID=2583234 RepID=A0A6M1TVA5_9RHOB|nr:hypothetical protein [Rhodobacter kunshanensis]NGQ92318.1 hypothetical protein [Rhodobacter kunshanensis]